MSRYYATEENLQAFLAALTRRQTENKLFLNISVKKYTGKKYSGNIYTVKEG